MYRLDAMRWASIFLISLALASCTTREMSRRVASASSEPDCNESFKRVMGNLSGIGFRKSSNEFEEYTDLAFKIPDSIKARIELRSLFERAGGDQRVLDATFAEGKSAKLVSLNSLLGPFAKSYSGKDTMARGAPAGNCFNAVLNWHGLSDVVRIDSPKKMREQLRRNFRLLKNEAPALGDLLIVVGKDTFSEDTDLIHAAIVIDNAWVWNKANYGADAPWVYQKFQDLKARYSKGKFKYYRLKY